MDLDLHDRVIVIPDATSALARESATVLVAEGARVVLGCPASQAPAVVGELGGPARAVAVTRTETEPPRAAAQLACDLVSAARETWQRLDGALVISDPSPARLTISDIADEEWRDRVATGLTSPFALMRGIADSMHEGGALVLALTTDVARAELAEPGGSAAALDRGLASLVMDLSEELAPRGIRANVVLAPGFEVEPTGTPESREQRVALRRRGRPGEFATVAAFVLSPAASYVTGALLPIDGGARSDA